MEVWYIQEYIIVTYVAYMFWFYGRYSLYYVVTLCNNISTDTGTNCF